jgi:pyruvate dehydrogenase E1 component beta subunit
MSEEMRRDKRVFLMGEEVAQYNGAYKVSRGMLDEFGPKRVIDTPISESGFAGMAIGAAMMGLRPIVEFMSWSFSLVAADPILNNAPKMLYMSGGQFGCPIVFRGNDGAGGQLGSTHSWCVEGDVQQRAGREDGDPANPYDAKGLLKTAIRDDDPVFFLESERMLGDKGDVPEEEYYIPFGRGPTRTRGRRLHDRLLRPAGALLPRGGRDAGEGGHRVRGARHADDPPAGCRVDRAVGQEDELRAWWSIRAGPSPRRARKMAALVHQHCFDDLDNHVHRVHSHDVPAPYAYNLEQEMLPNARRICEAVRSVTYNA